MPLENVEVVRAAFEAWNRGDYEAWLGLWDESAELFPFRAQLEGEPYRGHEGLRRFVSDTAEDWDEMRFQVDDIRGSGEQVVGVGRFRARGRGSGADLDVPLGVVGIVRSEKIVHARFFSDPADALRAAGPPD